MPGVRRIRPEQNKINGLNIRFMRDDLRRSSRFLSSMKVILLLNTGLKAGSIFLLFYNQLIVPMQSHLRGEFLSITCEPLTSYNQL